MSTLVDKLNTLFTILAQKKCPIVDLLQRPLTKEEIDVQVESLPLRLPDEIYSLYMWRNGVTSTEKIYSGAGSLIPGAVFYEFSNAVLRYHEYAGKDEFWNSSKFLVFDSVGGEMHIMECDESSKDFGKIFYHDISALEFDTLISIYDSLDTMLDTVIECYIEGLYSCDPIKGIKHANDDAFAREAEISKKHNPQSLYWTLF